MVNYRAAQLDYSNSEFQEDVFEAFFEEYFKKIYNYIFFRIGHNETAEDLTETVFYKILNNMKRYDSAKSNLSTWVFSIVRNTLTDYFRKKKEILLSEEDMKNLESEGIEDMTSTGNWEREERQRNVLALLDVLSERERDIISLKFFAELSNGEIAERLDLKANHVNVIVYRSLKKMRNCVEKHQEMAWGGHSE